MHPLNKLVHHHILGWLLVGRDDSPGSSAVQAAVTSTINMRRHPPISDKSSDSGALNVSVVWTEWNVGSPLRKVLWTQFNLVSFLLQESHDLPALGWGLNDALELSPGKFKSHFWNIGGRYMHSKNLGLSRHWVNNVKMSGKNLLGGRWVLLNTIAHCFNRTLNLKSGWCAHI